MALGRFVLLALLFCGTFGTLSAQAIDCASAALNHSERAVCASGTLHALAIGMDRHYARVADSPDVRRSQQQWLDVRDQCNGNPECLTHAYRERDAYLAALPAIVDAAAGPTSTAAPINHLFLRHAPAQLLSPSPAVASSSASRIGERPDRAAGPDPTLSPAPRWSTVWLLGTMLVVCVVLWQALTNVCGKCPHCHQWFARVELDRQPVPDDAAPLAAARRPGPFTHTDARTRERESPAAVRHYNQCRVCLHEWETVTQPAK